MNKKLILIIIGVVIALAGVTTTYALKMKSDNNKQHAAMMKHDAAMKHEEAMKQEEKAKLAAAAAAQPADAMKHDEAMAAHGDYISLAAYNSSKDKYSDSKKVLFFHASWCPICQSIDKSITSSPDKVPAKTTIIKTDFDSETALRKQYGVTQQYTFVQIDNSGKQLKKWSATNLADVLSQIQ